MLKIAVCLALLGYAAAVPIDNGVEGDPEIECGPDSVRVNFNTQQDFEGHVYVKGRFGEEACKVSSAGENRRVAGITLDFNTCGTLRERSLNPKGVFVSNTVVITFHPQFITKVDQAFKIQCFYMEADKTVTTELEVSMLTTQFRTQNVPMPICRYEILDGGPTGDIIQYALVGQQVYHKWTCDTETTDTFCMSVYSCFVDDGEGNRVDLIGEDGCALDRYLLNNIEYQGALMGGVQAHVFKYADKPQLYFNCQIKIGVRDPDTESADCANSKVRNQGCSEPEGRGGRKKRSVSRRYADDDFSNILDVSTRTNVLDIDDQVEALPGDLAHKAPLPRHYREPVRALAAQDSGICMSPAILFSFLALSVALAAAVVTVGSCLLVRRNEKA